MEQIGKLDNMDINTNTAKPLSALTKEELLAQASQLELNVRNYELNAARNVGFDLGQATIIRQLAKEKDCNVAI